MGFSPLFSLLDMLLYVMVQLVWVAFSFAFVSFFVRRLERKLCWDCIDGQVCSSSLCSVRFFSRCRDMRNISFRCRFVIGSLLFLVALLVGFYLVFMIDGFFMYKFDVGYVMKTLPSSWFEFFLLFVSLFFSCLSVRYVVRQVRYLWGFSRRVGHLGYFL